MSPPLQLVEEKASKLPVKPARSPATQLLLGWRPQQPLLEQSMTLVAPPARPAPIKRLTPE